MPQTQHLSGTEHIIYHVPMPDDSQKEFRDQLFSGLKSLAESSFPKTCAGCGRTYQTPEEFLLETAQVRATHAGLKETVEDDGLRCVEVFRNCPCGSTLMDLFSNRRDPSEESTEHRNRFEALIEFLMLNGLDHDTARTELLKVTRGENSTALATLHSSKKNR
jgi:hypothetical protein